MIPAMIHAKIMTLLFVNKKKHELQHEYGMTHACSTDYFTIWAKIKLLFHSKRYKINLHQEVLLKILFISADSVDQKYSTIVELHCRIVNILLTYFTFFSLKFCNYINISLNIKVLDKFRQFFQKILNFLKSDFHSFVSFMPIFDP